MLIEFIYQGEEVDVHLLVLKAAFEGRKTVQAGMLNRVLSNFWRGVEGREYNRNRGLYSAKRT